MTVEEFTQQDFEEALSGHQWKYVGMQFGEHCYTVPAGDLGAEAFVIIRSSIGSSGLSDPAGEDSIRMQLVDPDLNLLGYFETYTTRVPGWRQRVESKIQDIIRLRQTAGDCPVCGRPLSLLEVKKDGPNHGRPFASCKDRAHESFRWLDKPRGEPHFSNRVSDPVSEFEDVDPSISLPTADVSSLLAIVDESTSDYKTVVLNAEQRAMVAAPFDCALRVLAGAGSGKTTTSRERYAAMVASGIDASQIVMVTFGSKAAEHMRRMMEGRGLHLSADALNQICTIHALCLRLLKSVKYYKDAVSVASTWEVKKIIEPLIATYEPDDNARPGWEEVLRWINTCKAHFVSVKSMHRYLQDREFTPRQATLVTDIRQVFDSQLRAAGKLTFPDMLYDMEWVLNNMPEIKKLWQVSLRYLFIDEAQDTNHQAMRILTALFDHTDAVTFIGDPDQLLYRFAGATPEANLYEGFEKRYPRGQTVMLPTNYRSTKRIVSYGLNLIRHNYVPGGGPYDEKYLKALESASPEQGLDAYLISYPDASSEAKGVVAIVQDMTSKPSIDLEALSPGDFFIAARTRAQLAYLEAAFSQTEIPFVNTAGTSFFDLGHVADVLAYMRIMLDLDQREAWKRIVNIASNNMTFPWKNDPEYGKYCSHRFLGTAFLLEVPDLRACYAFAKNYHHPKQRTWGAGVEDILDLVSVLKPAASEGPAQLIDAIMDSCYARYLQATSGDDEHLGEGSKNDDIASLRDLAVPFPTVQDFFVYIDRALEAARASKNADWDGRAVLSTLHKLKGLERPVVIGVGVSEGVESHRDYPYGLLPHTFSMTEPPSSGKLPAGGLGRIEDERCLMYVQITRAMKVVILSSVESYRDRPMQPSRFILEMSDETRPLPDRR